ncbi:MAG: hypothetical protein GQ477_02265 [Nanohaloarchaea archaeon]|nr:hypothetical protein [Candidatus Nanohaloarchaea archaeon]
MSLKNDKSIPIYVGDQVIGNSCWAGDDENPYKGKTGTVVKIEHDIQSIFNRDYLAISVDSGDKIDTVWAYTLDILESTQRNLELSNKKQLIYIDDTVKVTDEQHPHFKRYGTVRAIYDSNGTLNYEVRDALILKSCMEFGLNMVDMINIQFKKRMSDETEFEEFKIRVKEEKPGFYYESLKSEENFKDIYKMLIRQDVIEQLETDEEYKKIKKEIQKLEETNLFSVDDSSVKLMKTSFD